MWWASIALAAPSPAAHWIAGVELGASPQRIAEVVGRSGAASVEQLTFQQPGAFARGLLDAPWILAQLHRAGVEPSWFDGLPSSGPSFVVVQGSEGRGSYVFVGGKLEAMALTLTAQAVAPASDPFRRDRLEPLMSTLSALCGSLRPTDRDEYGNAVAWKGDRCSGGTLVARYRPQEPDAALQVVVFAR